MQVNIIRLPFRLVAKTSVRPGTVALSGALALALAFSASAQQADRSPQPAPASAAQTPAAAPAPAPAARPSVSSQAGEITEAEVKQMLVGKQLFMLGGYMNDNLTFNEYGVLIGHSPTGSYTLNAIQINRVKLNKHKLELEGDRYALHFLGNLPNEEIGKSVDPVKITPNKKAIRITIDRELVVAPAKRSRLLPWGKPGKPATTAKAAAQKPAATPAQPAAEPSEAEQIKASIAAAPAAERPADPGASPRAFRRRTPIRF